ncbi:receptor-like protein 43, partial [Quercus suber]
LSKLTFLDLSYNYELHLRSLQGLVQNLPSLEDLRLSLVQISSPVPEILGNLSCLRALDLSDCGLHGEFPPEIFKLPNLRDLWASLIVNYQGQFHLRLLEAQTLLPCPGLGRLGSCNLRHFPNFLRKQDELQGLDLSYNNIRGQIPKWVWNTSRETLTLALTNILKIFHGLNYKFWTFGPIIYEHYP